MALQKHLSLVIAFDTTTAAMAAESCLHEKGLPGRIIPLPNEISAGCGLAWKAEPSDEDTVRHALDEAGVAYRGAYVVSI